MSQRRLHSKPVCPARRGLGVGRAGRTNHGSVYFAECFPKPLHPLVSHRRHHNWAIGRRRWGYVTEEYDDFPDYIPNMGAFGESKPGNTPGEKKRGEARRRRGGMSAHQACVVISEHACFVVASAFDPKERPLAGVFVWRVVQLRRVSFQRVRVRRSGGKRLFVGTYCSLCTNPGNQLRRILVSWTWAGEETRSSKRRQTML